MSAIHMQKRQRFSSHDSTRRSRRHHRPVSCPLSSRQLQGRGDEGGEEEQQAEEEEEAEG
jgi:hypothetical protein